METGWSSLSEVAAPRSVEVEDFACGRDGTRDAGCTYTTLLKTVCSLERDASGKPVQKCEKTKQLLRRCPGQSAEVVDSKVESTEEDASKSHPTFSLDYDRFGPGGADTSRADPFRGLFENNSPAPPRALEEFVQDLFGGPFHLSQEIEGAAPPATAPGSAGHVFGWFKSGPFAGGGRKYAPPQASSSDPSQLNQGAAKFYEELARGVQEV